MRFYITIFIAVALALASPVCGANFLPVIQMYNSAGGGGDYDDIIFHWSAETSGTWSNSTKPSGITGTISGGGISQDGSIYKVGSYSGKTLYTWDYITWTISSSHFEKEGGQLAFWFRTESTYAGSQPLITLTDGSSNSLLVDVNYLAGPTHYIRPYWTGNGSTAGAYSYTDISVSTWYYVVVKWEPGAAGNDLVLTVYNDDCETEFATASNASITAMDDDPTSLIFTVNAALSTTTYIDNLIISNSTTRDMAALCTVTSFE